MGAAASTPRRVKAEPPRGIILKEGELLYCETQGEDWKSYQFDLYENSTFVWSFNGHPPNSVILKSVVDQICVGRDCEENPDCPEPPRGMTVNYMISFPHNYPAGTRPTDMKNNWIVFRDDREMREWIAALEDVLNVKPLGVQSKPKKAPPQPVMISSQLAPLEIQPDPQEGSKLKKAPPKPVMDSSQLAPLEIQPDPQEGSKLKKAPPKPVMNSSQLAPLEIQPDPQEGSKLKKAPPKPVMISSQLAPLEIQPDPQEGLPKDSEKKDDTEEEEIQHSHTDFRLLLADGQASSRYSEDNMPHFGQA